MKTNYEDLAVDAGSDDDDALVNNNDMSPGDGSNNATPQERRAVEGKRRAMEMRPRTRDTFEDPRDPSDAENDDVEKQQDHISGASEHQSFNPISRCQISKQRRIPALKKNWTEKDNGKKRTTIGTYEDGCKKKMSVKK